MSQPYFQHDEAQFIQHLSHLVQDKSEHGFLIVTCGNDYYIQFMTSHGKLMCEAVSNVYLPKQSQLTAEQIAHIIRRGFTGPGEAPYFVPNFRRDFDLTPDQAVQNIVRESCDIFATVYGCDPSSHLQFELEP